MQPGPAGAPGYPPPWPGPTPGYGPPPAQPPAPGNYPPPPGYGPPPGAYPQPGQPGLQPGQAGPPPGYGPGQPGPGAQPGAQLARQPASPPPPGVARLIVECKYMPLSFMLAFTGPSVFVDGREVGRTWGSNVVDVPPGPHQLLVHTRYMGTIGPASLDLHLTPGQVVTVRYGAPLTMFGNGKLDFQSIY